MEPLVKRSKLDILIECEGLIINGWSTLLKFVAADGIKSQYPNIFHNNLFVNMNKRVIFLLVCVLLNLAVESAPISIDLNGSQATLFQDKKLKVLFKSVGGNGVYQFQFKNIPASWKIVGNSIIIQNFTLLRDQSWRFDVYVTDTEGNYLSQTLMISFMGFYVGFTAITMPTTGKINLSDNYNNSPFAVFPGVQQNSYANYSPYNQTENQQARITDLVGDYPGLDNYNRLMNGYNDPSLSTSTPDYVSATQPVVDPKSSLYTAQKQAAMRRQQQANQAVSSLAALYDKLSMAINKMNQDAKNEQNRANAARALVIKCDSQLFSLEDTKTKINNAISDKQQRLDQYKTQISKSEKQIQTQTNKLTSFQQDKRTIETTSLPNSKALQSLQQLLDQCRSSSSRNTVQLQDTKIKLDKTQTQIKMLTIESNEAKVKLQKLRSDLTAVRDKISNLQSSLREARNLQSNILGDINRYDIIPVRNDIRIKSLQSDAKYLTNDSKNITSTMVGCSIYEDRLSNIQNIVNKDRQRYNEISKNIQDQQIILDRAKNNLLQLKKSSSSLPMQISTLKNEMFTYDDNIRRTGYLCEDNVTEYSRIALSLKNLKDKIQQSNNQLNKTNTNLIDAKNQLQLANSAAAQAIKAQNNYRNNNNVAPNVNTPANAFNQQTNQFTNTNTNTNINTNFNTNTRPTTNSNTVNQPQVPKNPNDLSIDDIINSILNQKPGTSPTQSSTSTTSRPTITPTQPTIASTAQQQQQNNQARVTPQAPVQTATNQDFSISTYLAQQQQAQTQQQPAQSGTGSSLPPATYQINNSNQNTQQYPSQNYAQNAQNSQNFGQTYPTTTLSATSELGDQFKIATASGFRAADAYNAQDYLFKKYKIYMSGYPMAQNRMLYTLDDVTLRILTGKGSAQRATFQPFLCSDATIVDSAVIQDVGLGYILAKSNNNIQYRLSLGDCSKVASLGTSNSLKQGTRIFFTGSPLVSLPGNILLNVHLIVSNPI